MASSSNKVDYEDLRKNAKLGARKAFKKQDLSNTRTYLIIAGIVLIIGIFSSLLFMNPEQPLHLVQALDPDFLTTLTQMNLSFKVKQNTFFKDWSLADVKLAAQTGTSQQARNLSPCTSFFADFEPAESYDLRDEFQLCIQDPQDQLNCSSSYSFATASAAAERFCIKSNSANSPKLSLQQMVSCSKKNSGCTSGNIDTAWEYIRDSGLVESLHFPYTSQHMKFPDCTEKQDERLYRVTDVCATNSELGIMKEIQTNGPVVALIHLYTDFLPYSSGVYFPSSISSKIQGAQAVSIIGWGSTENYSYWIVKNSWGTSWGEAGYALVLRNSTELGIEDLAVAGSPIIETNTAQSE